MIQLDTTATHGHTTTAPAGFDIVHLALRGGALPVPGERTRVAGLYITPMPDEHGRWDGWALTHGPTGRYLAWVDHPTDAQDLAERLGQVYPDWTNWLSTREQDWPAERRNKVAEVLNRWFRDLPDSDCPGRYDGNDHCAPLEAL